MKVPFGFHKETNRFIGIDEAKNGLMCGCVCPECRMRLKARQGKIEHHFAHHDTAEVECNYSYWVSIRSMAKQIICENEIQLDYSSLKTFAPIPWAHISPIKVLSKKADPTIWEYQFDVEVKASFGTYYIHLLTDKDDSGRSRKHAIKQSRGNAFSSYLVMEIDLKDVKKYKNKDAKSSLEDLIIRHKDNKLWFSTCTTYQKKQKLNKVSYPHTEKYFIHKTINHSFYEKELPYLPVSDDMDKLVKKMRKFYDFMKRSFSHKDKQTADLTVIYKGKDLWYVSCCHEFFCISYQYNTFIVYEVSENQIVRLTSCCDFRELDYTLKSYLVNKDQLL